MRALTHSMPDNQVRVGVNVIGVTVSPYLWQVHIAYTFQLEELSNVRSVFFRTKKIVRKSIISPKNNIKKYF